MRYITGLFGLSYCLTLLNAAALVAENPRPPNVVIILADDLGFSDLGCYGGEIATPHLDWLAAGGLRYTQFYNTARCWPTRAALLTGYYAQQVRRDALPGVQNGSRNSRPSWAHLLPELLREHGYRSYHSGKWHIDGSPMTSGFDHSYLSTDHNRFFHPQSHQLDDKPLPAVRRGTDYYATTAIADHAIDCLKEHATDHPGQPFFQYIAFIAPHFPLQALSEDIDRYRGKYSDGWDAIRAARWQHVKDHLGIPGQLSALEPQIGPPYHFPDALETLGPVEVNRELPWDELTADQRRFQAEKMAIHAGMVDRIDQEVGRVLDQLRTMNALENTVLFFLSDNGASAEIMIRGDGHDPSAAPGSADSYLCLGPGWSSAANTPFRRHKTWVHEGGIATPLIVHWPKAITTPGELRHSVGHVIDLAPTIVQLAGGKWPTEYVDPSVPPVPGKSLVPTLAGDVESRHDALWWLHEGNRAIRIGDWKLVAAKGDPWELYNLAHDRVENVDLAQHQPEKVEEMAARWEEMTAEFVQHVTDQVDDVEADPQTRTNLKQAAVSNSN